MRRPSNVAHLRRCRLGTMMDLRLNRRRCTFRRVRCPSVSGHSKTQSVPNPAVEMRASKCNTLQFQAKVENGSLAPSCPAFKTKALSPDISHVSSKIGRVAIETLRLLYIVVRQPQGLLAHSRTENAASQGFFERVSLSPALIADGLSTGCGSARQRDHKCSTATRRAQPAKRCCHGQAELSCTCTRRTLMLTTAATFKSFKRMVPTVARASSVPLNVSVRNRSNSKYASVLSHSRN
jgi:hypothetical protein